MGLWPLEYVFSYCAGIDCRRQNLTSTDVVNRRQILTTKVDPRAVRVNEDAVVFIVDLTFNNKPPKIFLANFTCFKNIGTPL